jgi:N-acetylglucosamine malate deacetylase 1
MESEPLRMLVFGAHPDDCEELAGGLTALYTRLGHQVMFVSLTNGDAGHLELAGAPLARRRRAEAQSAASVLGAQSLVLDHHDGTLMPTLEVREQVIRIIREFRPDLVMAHRPYDYHPDHRYTGVVVQDAINMVIVDNLVPYIPALHYIPVMMYLWDHFRKPYPFIPEVVVDIDEVFGLKIDALDCHTSQMYEFLYGKTELPLEKRRAWLKERVEEEMAAPVNLYREQVIQIYGQARGKQIHYVEAFELCEYGGRLTPEKREWLFPFLPK